MINRDEYKNQNRESIGLTISDVEVEQDNRPICLLIGIDVNDAFPKAGLMKGIQRSGYRCEFLDWQKIKMLETVEGLAARAVRKAQDLQPDLIICQIQTTDSMMPKTFQVLQMIAPVVNLTVDKRENNEWMYEVAPLISLTCFSNAVDVKICEERGVKNTISLHSSCDYDFYSPPEQPYKIKYNLPEIAFIGGDYSKTNLDFPLKQQRHDMVEFLSQVYENRFMAAGMGQKISKIVGAFEELAVYRQCKIIIGQNQFQCAKYSSDRIWRAMGSGAFFLSSYYPGIEDDFEIGKHLDVWYDFDDLKNKIDYYLEHDSERNEIAARGTALVRGSHRWQDRFETIIKTLKIKK